MNTRDTSQSRILIAVGALVLSLLACGATAPATAPTAGPVTRPQGSVTPRILPTLVPTYTRVPTLTPTLTPIPTSTRTPTLTRTVTPTLAPTATPIVYVPWVPTPYLPPACTPPEQRTDLIGKIIFARDDENHEQCMGDSYYVMDADGKNQKLLDPSPKCAKAIWTYYESRLSITADSKFRLTVDSAGKGTRIFLRDAAGVLIRQVFDLDGINYSPAWAPDQSRFAFVAQVDMNDEIYTSTVDGLKIRRLTFNTWEWDKHPSWSPDGKSIIFWSNREVMRKQIWTMRADDGAEPRNLSNNEFQDCDPIWVNR
jgi:hypothetical protein